MRNVSASMKGSGLYTRGVKQFYWAVHLAWEKVVWTLNPELANKILKYYNIDCDLISKKSLEELKNPWLQGQWEKKGASGKSICSKWKWC